MDYENPCEEFALINAEYAVDYAKEAIKAAEAGDLDRCFENLDDAEHLLGAAKMEAEGAYTERAWTAFAAAADMVRRADEAYCNLCYDNNTGDDDDDDER